MTPLRTKTGGRRYPHGIQLGFSVRLPFLALALAAPAMAAISLHAATLPVNPPGAPISLAEYQLRLQTLDRLVVTCQQYPGSANCHSEQVGPDLDVAAKLHGTRQIRFAWLRALLEEAAQSGSKLQQAPKTSQKSSSESSPNRDAASLDAAPLYIPPTIAQQLEDAHTRLSEEMQQAADLANPTPSVLPKTTAVGQPRETLAAILAAPEYHPAVQPPSLWQSALEKIGAWVNSFLAKLIAAGASSRWFGYAAEIVFGLSVCAALIWFLIRVERQGRLDPASISPGSQAASARDWQLWLEDAGKAAALGAWRDAIHLTYWASISRLESAGQWPADRARTPREYLALLSHESPERLALASLTRSLERTWYAGCPAQEPDFRQAEETAASLGARLRHNSRRR